MYVYIYIVKSIYSIYIYSFRNKPQFVRYYYYYFFLRFNINNSNVIDSVKPVVAATL